MAKQNKLDNVDGRRLRSERSKRAIIDACTTLVNEGVLVPTAQLISDKAGVPIRSFFRHFPDMETLFRTMDDELREVYAASLSREVPSGTLEERVGFLVDSNVKSFESARGIIESTKAQLWRYKILRDNYARWQRNARKNRERRIPELVDAEPMVQELVDGAASWEMWSRLRDHQKLSATKSTRMVKVLIFQLLTEQS